MVDYGVKKGDYRNVSDYDEKRYIGPANEYKKRVTSNACRELIDILQGKRILDVGCETGRGLTDFVETAKLTVGADTSQDMSIVSAEKVQGRTGVGLVRSYAQSLPFPSDTLMSLYR